MSKLTRRGFVGGVAAMAAAPGIAKRSQGTQQTVAPATSAVPRIDFLGSPGLFNDREQANGEPLTDAMVENAKASGVSAINLTVFGDSFESACSYIALWERELNRHPDVLARVRTVADLLEAQRSKRLGLIYGFQGIRLIGDDLDRLDLFSHLGVRVVLLTYNVRDLVGDGCLEPGNAGLSNFGRAAVERLNSLGVVVDLAHCGQRTTADGIAHSKAPVAISHSGCQALADLPRNKRDEELRAMADRGGVFGVYLMPFLAVGRAPTGDDVIAHLEHAIDVCGEDHVGIGRDQSLTPLVDSEAFRKKHREFVEARQKFGVAAPGESPERFYYVADVNSPRRLELIGDRLRARGHSSARIDKILGGNWLRLVGEVWPGPKVEADETRARRTAS